MPRLGSVTVDVWPRQQGATKNFHMDVVKSAVFDKKRVCLVVMNEYSEADIRKNIADIIDTGGIGHIDPYNLDKYGIQLMFELPQPYVVCDLLYLMQAGDNIDWAAVMNYARKQIDVKVVRIYDEETHQYV